MSGRSPGRAAGPGATTTPLLHVDMDAFYASVLLRERVELRDVPVIVGGGHRGVVLAANYPARAFGVRSGMPGSQALRRCPQAVVLAPDYAIFAAVSSAVMDVFARVTPLVEAVSMDEAFLDVSGAIRRLGEPRAIAEWLRATIHDEQAITCSVGIAASISVAKLASRRAKPDGVVVVTPEAVVDFLHPLDVGELYGVGEATRAVLHRHGLRTVADLAHAPVEELRAAVGGSLAAHLLTLAWGTDRRDVRPGSSGVFGYGARSGQATPDRSMGAQETFAHDTDERDVIARHLLQLSAKVAGRLRAASLSARTVAITVRYADFETITRSRSAAEPTDVTQEIYRTALGLYDALGRPRRRIRLVGVRVEGLRARRGLARKGVLGEREHGWAEADRAVDSACRRFGRAAVRPGSLLDRAATGAEARPDPPDPDPAR